MEAQQSASPVSTTNTSDATTSAEMTSISRSSSRTAQNTQLTQLLQNVLGEHLATLEQDPNAASVLEDTHTNATLETNHAPNQNTNDANDTTTNDLDDLADLASLINWISKNAIFLILAIIVFVIQNRNPIAILIWFASVYINASAAINRIQQSERNIASSGLFLVTTVLVGHVIAALVLLPRSQLRFLITFLPSQYVSQLSAFPSLSFIEAMWVAVINDLLLRFIFLVITSAFMIFHNQKLQLVTNQLCWLYRNLCPTPVWFCFFMGDGPTYSHTTACLLTAAYLALKLLRMIKLVDALLSSLKFAMTDDLPYGKKLPSNEVSEDGGCSICQEQFTSPVKLHCQHVFCQACIESWFQREKTCPLCRTVVVKTTFAPPIQSSVLVF